MIKHFSVSRLVMICLAVSFLFISCNWGSSGDNEKVIVCLGDGLTLGSRLVDESMVDDPAHSYPVYLQGMLDDSNKGSYTVINAGVRMDKTGTAYTRLENDVIAKDPDIVIVTLGIIDLERVVITASSYADISNGIDTIGDNLGKIIDRLDDGNRRIYVANSMGNGYIALLFTGNPFIDASDVVTAIHNMMSGLCSANPQTRTYIPDVLTGIWGNADLQPTAGGNIWPNAAGYERMAKTYFDALMK